METVALPRNLDHRAAVDLTVQLKSLERGSAIRLIIPDNLWVTPFGMLVSCAALRGFFLNLPDLSGPSFSYPRFMGWARCLSDDYPPGASRQGETYIPIRRLVFDASNKMWRDTVLNTSFELADLVVGWSEGLMRRQRKNLKRWLSYTFRELIRNTPEHAATGEVWVAAQYWPTTKLVEIAVLDQGIGVFNSLKKNPDIAVNSDVEALLLSIQPGMSSVPEDERETDSIWDNSGFGLYVLSSLASSAKGEFQLLSGNKMLTVTNTQKTTMDAFHHGTAVRMRIKPTELERLERVLPEIVEDGETFVHKKASKVTKTIF